MTQNPFQTPQAAADPYGSVRREATGRIDIGEAISEAWTAMTSNVGVAIGGFVVAFLVMMVGYVTIIGIFLVIPVVMYGAVRLILNILDGQGEVGDIFEGFKSFGEALLPMLQVAVVFIAISIPTFVLIGLGAALEEPVLTALGQIVNLVVSIAVGLRLYFAPFFVVDQGISGFEACKASWDATSDQKLVVIGLSLLTGIIAGAGAIALCIGMLFTIPLSYLIYGAAYRQLVGAGE